ISPGATFMLPEDRREYRTEYFQNTDSQDTVYSGDFNRKGKIGFYLEAGRHHFIKNRFVLDHIDYGVHFKMLRGQENFEGLTNVNNTPVPVANRATYSES